MEDLRDLHGRVCRLVVSILVGAVGSVALAWSFPLSEVQPWLAGCMGRAGSQIVREDAFLLIAGAVAIAYGCYALLGHLARRPRLPRARLLR